LLELMADATLAEERLPAERPAGWRGQLEVAARLQWRVFRRHPWLVRLMSITRPRPLGSALAHADWVLGALAARAIDADTCMQMHVMLHAFVQGMAVNLETEADAASETGLSDVEWMDAKASEFAALASSGSHPAFAAVLRELPQGFDLDLDSVFELGLRCLLDGIARSIDEAAAPGSGAR